MAQTPGQAYQALQREPRGRISTGGNGGGPMRPIIATFSTSSTNPVTAASSFLAGSKLVPVFNQGPMFDDREAMSIDGSNVICGPGIWLVEFDVVFGSTDLLDTMQIAICDGTGTPVIHEQSATVAANLAASGGDSRAFISAIVHITEAATTAQSIITFRANQISAGTNNLAYAGSYIGSIEKIGNADEATILSSLGGAGS